jgi:hypothetical protein
MCTVPCGGTPHSGIYLREKKYSSRPFTAPLDGGPHSGRQQKIGNCDPETLP